jgi:hypothetical protein
MGQLTGSHESAVKDLLILDSLRGHDSVGLAAVTSTGLVRVAKHAMLPQQFLNEKDVKELFIGVNRCMIGHNRFATVGAVNDLNAHPFEFDNIVGAHNGSLRNQSLLPDHQLFEVDSQVLLNGINNLGTEGVENKIHGAFALTWYNKQHNTLHMWRNRERPLWYCFTDDNKVMFWASEPFMLAAALSRRAIKFKEPKELPVNKEFVFDVHMAFGKEIAAPAIFDRKEYVPPPVVTTSYSTRSGGGWNDFEDSDYAGWDKKELPKVITERGEVVKKQQPLLLGRRSEEEERKVEQEFQTLRQARLYALRLKRLAALLLVESLSTTAK